MAVISILDLFGWDYSSLRRLDKIVSQMDFVILIPYESNMCECFLTQPQKKITAQITYCFSASSEKSTPVLIGISVLVVYYYYHHISPSISDLC